ncbi:MAG: RND family transporter, partial [Porticoccaceae bacterium]
MDGIVRVMFGNRMLILLVFAGLAVFMGINALKLRVDAGFEKLLPLKHDYIQTLLKYQNDFGTGNQIVVALIQKEGTIFNPEFFKAMKLANDEVFFLPGVARSTVTSIMTPNVRFIEVVEDGFSGGNVVPAEFRPTEEWMPVVRNNIIKSGRLGNLVANDFSGAMIRAELIDRDPTTRLPLDYQKVARDLENNIRAKFESGNIDVRIIGFAKSTGDIADGARGVIGFFGITLIVTALLLWWYSGSL